jgi:hypothetical protein
MLAKFPGATVNTARFSKILGDARGVVYNNPAGPAVLVV